jgi:hypothetical protein
VTVYPGHSVVIDPRPGQCTQVVCDDTSGGTEVINKAPGTACSDNNPCTTPDTCSGSTCQNHLDPCNVAPNPYSDGDCAGGCRITGGGTTFDCMGNEPASSPCNDGNGCNGYPDRCAANGNCNPFGTDPCAGTYGDNDCHGCVSTMSGTSRNCDSSTAPEPSGSACIFTDGAGGAEASCCNGTSTSCPNPGGGGSCP